MNTPGKSCGTCSLCCKLVYVEELQKPAHQWCVHNRPGKGCAIWGEHPEVCKAWQCGWILMPQLDERWKPERCGFILRNRFESQQLVIDVDPAKPDAWRKAPYLAEIRAWAKRSVAARQQVVVCVGRRAFGVFAEEEIDAGVMPEGVFPFLAYQHQGPMFRPVVLLKREDGTVVGQVPGAFRLRGAS